MLSIIAINLKKIKCYVTIDVRLLELKKDLNPDIILITQKKPIRKDLDL